MAEPATERAHGAERTALGLDGLEGVARAATLAEGFGQDLGHRLPGSISKPAAPARVRRDDTGAFQQARHGRRYRFRNTGVPTFCNADGPWRRRRERNPLVVSPPCDPCRASSASSSG